MLEQEGQQTFCSIHRVWDFCSLYVMPDALKTDLDRFSAAIKELAERDRRIAALGRECAAQTEAADALRDKLAEAQAELKEHRQNAIGAAHLAALLRAGEPLLKNASSEGLYPGYVRITLTEAELRALAAALEKARGAKP